MKFKELSTVLGSQQELSVNPSPPPPAGNENDDEDSVEEWLQNGAREPEIESSFYHFLVVLPWANSLTFLCLSFPISVC